jgi:hypothetical protein
MSIKSQSDYTKHLKIVTELKNQTEFSPVLETKNYTLFKEYEISKTIVNTSKLYGGSGVLQQPTPQPPQTNCPTFIVCHNTNQRPHRVPLINAYITPIPVATFVKQLANNQCSSCCYDNRNKKHNYFNMWNNGCSNYRLVKSRCNCKTI